MMDREDPMGTKKKQIIENKDENKFQKMLFIEPTKWIEVQRSDWKGKVGAKLNQSITEILFEKDDVRVFYTCLIMRFSYVKCIIMFV